MQLDKLKSFYDVRVLEDLLPQVAEHIKCEGGEQAACEDGAMNRWTKEFKENAVPQKRGFIGKIGNLRGPRPPRRRAQVEVIRQPMPCMQVFQSVSFQIRIVGLMNTENECIARIPFIHEDNNIIGKSSI